MTQEHPQAALLRAIADGKQMQTYRGNWDDWVNASSGDALHCLTHRGAIRIKPEVLTINGMEVPKPVDNGNTWLEINLQGPGNNIRTFWHPTEEAARRHFDVLVSASKGETL